MDDVVVELAAHIPGEVREAAKRAYTAKVRHQRWVIEVGQANRAFADACKRFNLDPAKIHIGEYCGMSFVPASMADE